MSAQQHSWGSSMNMCHCWSVHISLSFIRQMFRCVCVFRYLHHREAQTARPYECGVFWQIDLFIVTPLGNTVLIEKLTALYNFPLYAFKRSKWLPKRVLSKYPATKLHGGFWCFSRQNQRQSLFACARQPRRWGRSQQERWSSFSRIKRTGTCYRSQINSTA